MIELSKDAFSKYQNIYDVKDYLSYKKDPDNYEGNKSDMQIYDLLLRDGFELDDEGTYYLKELISFVTYELKQNNDISFRTLTYLIDNERSYVYVEVAKTYLEIGLQRFIDTIKKSNEMVNDGRDYKERALMYSALIASKSIDHQKKKTKNKKNL